MTLELAVLVRRDLRLSCPVIQIQTGWLAKMPRVRHGLPGGKGQLLLVGQGLILSGIYLHMYM